jgi:hypothetical protein
MKGGKPLLGTTEFKSAEIVWEKRFWGYLTELSAR